jgi:hypothetical protein
MAAASRKNASAMPPDDPANPPSSDDPNRFSQADVLELRDWAAIAAAKGWISEPEADPLRGQMKRIGTLPGGREFVAFSITGSSRMRHVRIERGDGVWIVRPVWKRQANTRTFVTLRRALEHLCVTLENA